MYIIAGISLGIAFDKTLKAVYKSDSYDSLRAPLSLSEEIYESMNYKMHYHYDDPNRGKSVFDSSFPMVLIWFNGGNVFYNYSYYEYDKNDKFLAGGASTPRAVIQIRNGKFTITDYHEPL